MASRLTIGRAYKRARATAGQVKRTVPRVVAMAPRVISVSLQRVVGRSDHHRWSNVQNLEEWWESRTQKLAQFIPPSSRVLEFGAGRRRLERYLPPGCAYIASDLTPHAPDTIVCDLNRRPLPDLRNLDPDVAVFSGVLEYVRDIPSLAGWLADQTSLIVASYDGVKSAPLTPARAIERWQRSYFGYLNNHTGQELVSAFSRAGFRCDRTDTWTSQQIFVFSRR